MDMTPLTELPEYWQQHIAYLRAERAKLRKGVIPRDQYLPSEAHREIRKLRAEATSLRVQRNEARAELAALRAERV